jgi:hypothetical protein
MQRLFFLLALIAGIAACSSVGSWTPNAPAQTTGEQLVPSKLQTITMGVTIPSARDGKTPNWVPSTTQGVAMYGYSVTGIPSGTPPPSSFLGYFNVSAKSSYCRSNGKTRTCTLIAKVPKGRDAIVAVLYSDARPIPYSSAPANIALAQAQTIQKISSPAIVPLAFSGIVRMFAIENPLLNNPSSPGSKTAKAPFSITVVPFDSLGTKITAGAFVPPIIVRVYGPPGLVTVPSASANATAVKIATSPAKATFQYSGDFFDYGMTVAAISGDASATAQLTGLHTPSPGACAALPTASPFMIAESAVLKRGSTGGGVFFNASIAGSKQFRVQVDTGSTGFYVSRGLLTTMGAKSNLMVGPGQPGTETLEPSGDVITGNYYLMPVTIYNGSQAETTIPMEVLVLPSDSVIKYMGVGFGRGSASPVPSSGPTPPASSGYLRTPVQNVFLQLQDAIEGTMRPGYELTANSLSVGLNASAVNGFTFNNLDPFPNRPGDWQGEPACVMFNALPYQCGRMLLDVGVDIMYVGPKPSATVTSIGVVAPNPSSTPLSYSFPYPVQPNASPPAPDPKASHPAIWITPSPLFVNTGRFALAASSYAYDAACGRVGFKPQTP